jgi:hypothetical protein
VVTLLSSEMVGCCCTQSIVSFQQGWLLCLVDKSGTFFYSTIGVALDNDAAIHTLQSVVGVTVGKSFSALGFLLFCCVVFVWKRSFHC